MCVRCPLFPGARDRVHFCASRSDHNILGAVIVYYVVCLCTRTVEQLINVQVYIIHKYQNTHSTIDVIQCFVYASITGWVLFEGPVLVVYFHIKGNDYVSKLIFNLLIQLSNK